MLKILFFADSHLGFDYPLRPKISMRRRGPDFFNNFHRILKYAEQNKPDLLIHGGDLFFRSRVAAVIVDMVYKAFFDFVNKTDIPIYIVPGNHERSHLPTSLYLAHPLISVFNKPRSFFFKKHGINVVLHGFPFFRGAIRYQFRELLKQCGWQTDSSLLQLLILHQAIDGARVGPSNYTFRNSKDVIDVSDIPVNATAVLSGHIHRSQVFYTAKNVPVIYPGSIERTSFAEKNEAKGFYEIDFISAADSSRTWIMKNLKFIKLPARPMADIYLTGHHSNTEIKQSIQQQCMDLPADSIIRLHMSGSDPVNHPHLNLSFIRKILPSSFNLQMAVPFR